MYIEPIECTVEEAEEQKQEALKEMQRCDSQIYKLRHILSEFDEYDPQNSDIVKGISNKIFYLSECANTSERRWDYWSLQAKWAKKRKAEK